MTSRPPSQLAVSTATRDADRMVRLRVFLKNHDIRYPDIAEQLEPLEGRPLSLQRVHGMLCRNAYMEKTLPRPAAGSGLSRRRPAAGKTRGPFSRSGRLRCKWAELAR